jgi:protein O-mannosyl-transferase
MRALLAIAAVTVLALAWQPAFAAPYQYDDFVTPVKDPASQSLASWAGALPATLRPLTKLTYAVESSLGAVDAPERRVLNGLLFLLAAALVAALAHAAGLQLEAAGLLALLWAAHPVHAELVVALAGRSVLLALALTLASALCLLRERAALALGCALLAVLARETAWPWLVACAGVAAARAGWSRARLAGAMAGAAAVAGVLVLSSSRLRALLAFSWNDPAAFDRLGLQWAALPRGMIMFFAEPAAFSVDIDFGPRGGVRALYLLAALGSYAAAGWLALRQGASLPLRIAALLWLCLVLPLHSVVPKLDPLTARGVAASSAALAVLIAAAAAPRLLSPRARTAWWLCGLLLLPALVQLTRERAALYRDPIALWRDAAARSRQSTRPLLNLGTLLAQAGQLEEARSVLAAAVRRDAHDQRAHDKLAAVDVLIETRSMLRKAQAHDSE